MELVISTWISLLEFVSLEFFLFFDMSTWNCPGSKSLLFNASVYSASNTLKISTAAIGRVESFSWYGDRKWNG